MQPRLTVLGKLMIGIISAGLLFVAYRNLGPALRARLAPPASGNAGATASEPAEDGRRVHLGVAYGTEKKLWLEWAAARFAETAPGRGVDVELIPLGSVEGAQAIVRGDQRITAWAPASSLYEPVFRSDWQLAHHREPFVRHETLALTPMVFVFWDERYRPFVAKYGAASFESVRRALVEPGGWQGIAGKPEWGFFKFGHTHPGESNSGLVTLVEMAYERLGKSAALTLEDILSPRFGDWLGQIEPAVSGLSNSTGNLMREMVLKGPSTFDAVFVYENVAIDYLGAAEGRWGRLHAAYPAVNLWNDNPFYVLDAPWVTSEQRAAAERFCDFLLSDASQRAAVDHGFRPGNPQVPILTNDSPWSRFAAQGLAVEMSTVGAAPSAEVLTNLQVGWQRRFGNR
jgi:hypothetical protein